MRSSVLLVSRRALCALMCCVPAVLGLACEDGPGNSAGGSAPAPAASRSLPAVTETLAMTRPSATGPVTWHDVREELLKWNRLTLGGAYRTVGSRGAWDGAAVKFLDRLAVYFTAGTLDVEYKPPNVPTHQELIGEGRALLTAGCQDPLVTYCYAAILHDSGDIKGAAEPLRMSALGLLNSNYPSYRRLAAARRLLKVETDSSVRMRAIVAAEDTAVLTARGPLSYIERRQAASLLNEHHAQKSGEKFMYAVEVLERTGVGDPWLVDLLAGKAHTELAWDARGSGFADTVTDDGWREFHHHLSLARDRLTRAWKLAPELPEAPTAMITVAMGAGPQLNEQEMTWFERAGAAQLDYTPAYGQLMGRALLPRWGGSHEAMYALGLACARTERYDTAMPRLLIDAVHRIRNDGGSWDILSKPGVFEQLSRVCDGYAAHAGLQSERAAWYGSLKAAIAWRAERFEDARRALEQVGDRVQPAAFASMRANAPDAAIGYVYAVTSEEAARVRSAEAAMIAGDHAAALGQFKAARDALAAQDRARPYLEARITLLDRRLRYAGGEWVDLKPATNLGGWRSVAGTWTVLPEDSSIFARSGSASDSPILMLDLDPGWRYELTGHIQREGAWGGGLAFGSGGRTLGFVLFSPRTVELVYKDSKKHVMARQHVAQVPTPPGMEFVCRFDNGKITVLAGDRTALDGITLPVMFRASPRIGLSVTPTGIARFTNLKIRKLPGGTPSAAHDPAADSAPDPNADAED